MSLWRDENGLTKRQRWVYDLMIQGLSTREIASRLFVTESAVKAQLTEIYKKTRKNRYELIAERAA